MERRSILRASPPAQHVDTSCYFFLEGSYHVLHYWVTMPRRVAPICDRIIFAALKNFRLRSVMVEKTTVYYECLWASIYAAIGEEPPTGAKPNIDWVSISHWLDTLTERELCFANRMSGSIVRSSPWFDLNLRMERPVDASTAAGEMSRGSIGG
jgi:hypothetical protein